MNKTFLILLLSFVCIAETVITPNMNLPVPVVGTTPGPDWANNINSCMSSIDSHDHTPGKGVPISASAIDINSDFSLNNNSLTDAKSVIFSPQSSFSTTKSLYVVDPDLFYNDGNGNTIQITQSGSVAGASGTITGLPSGTASASYQAVGGSFVFQSATNTPANIRGADIVVAEQVASVTPNAITIKAPTGLAASYNLTLPAAVPSATSLLSMATSGSLATVAYRAPTQQKFTSGSGTYTTPSNPSPMYIKVTLVGGGGGGGGSGSSGGSSGGSGGTTTFGTALLEATGGTGGGSGGGANPTGGAGGTASLGAASGIAVSGAIGGCGLGPPAVGNAAGGMGGVSPFGGAGSTNYNTGAGTAAVTNSGSGGGGGLASVAAGSALSGAGGGAGGYVDALITGPAASYAYAVGAAGSAGSAGTNGFAGGAGGSGIIVVTEYYQ